jgi:hypothetical protein
MLQAAVEGYPRRRRQPPRGSHASHGRHLVPRPLCRASLGVGRRDRAAGEGHGRHPRGCPPAAPQPQALLEAPVTTLDHYRRLGANAAAYALGRDPEPVVVPTRGEAMGARSHVEVALLYAIETGLCRDGAEPEEIAVEFTA